MTYEEAAAAIAPGLYRHFKGNYYRVLSIARHSETTEPMVVYQALYGTNGIWVRPADMWNETVERDGKEIRRFQPLNRAERISFYENLFDEVRSMSLETAASGEETRMKVRLLDEYYTSGEWQEDYEADEAGQLPADLKRGVLSQDGLYDFLTEWQTMKLSDILYEGAVDLWREAADKPFVKEMALGILDEEKFRNYMVQG